MHASHVSETENQLKTAEQVINVLYNSMIVKPEMYSVIDQPNIETSFISIEDTLLSIPIFMHGKKNIWDTEEGYEIITCYIAYCRSAEIYASFADCIC